MIPDGGGAGGGSDWSQLQVALGVGTGVGAGWFAPGAGVGVGADVTLSAVETDCAVFTAEPVYPASESMRATRPQLMRVLALVGKPAGQLIDRES